MIDVEAYRKRLLARREELMQRLTQLEEWLDDPVNPDVEERATERELDEVFEAQGLAGQEEVSAIDAALKRMENNVFGICLACGNEISEARLQAVPFAVKCRHCME